MARKGERSLSVAVEEEGERQHPKNNNTAAGACGQSGREVTWLVMTSNRKFVILRRLFAVILPCPASFVRPH